MYLKQCLIRIVTFILLVGFFTFLLMVPFQNVSAEVLISQISPDEGSVGTIVSVTGQISTFNGSYAILFDGVQVKNGTSTFTDVSDVFTVSNTTSGDHEIQLMDLNTTESSTENFLVQTNYIIKAVTPQDPLQLQEGANVTIIAEVTGGGSNETITHLSTSIVDPSNTTYSSDEFLIKTGTDGYGSASVVYPSEFNGGNHTTAFVGYYNMTFNKTLNQTLDAGNFTIGLSDAVEYLRFQTVNIKALNYTSSEEFTISIITNGKTVFESSPNASNGIIMSSWTIPANASLGQYRIEIDRKPPKVVPDIQNFSITSISYACEVLATNLEDEPVSNVLVQAINISDIVSVQVTNDMGIAVFLLEATNYTFSAFWKTSAELSGANVGDSLEVRLSENITDENAVPLKCALAHLKISATDSRGDALPLLGIRLNFTYIAEVTGLDVPMNESIFSETNSSGIFVFKNIFTNITYMIEASRYGLVFENTTLHFVSSQWLNFSLPEYELTILVYDREGRPLENANVRVFEWSIGEYTEDSYYVKEGITSADGNVEFIFTFSKYGISVYIEDTLVNSTTVNLLSKQTFEVRSELYPLTLNITIQDYFGQKIRSANVTLERQGIIISSVTTERDGVARFTELIGGNHRIFVFLGGEPQKITSITLAEPKSINLKVERVVNFAGFLMQTSHFATVLFVILCFLLLLFAFLYRRYKSPRNIE